MTTVSDIGETLVRAYPPIDALLAEHLRDNFGELLPTTFLADVGRLAERLAASGLEEEVDRVLAGVSDLLANGDEQLRNAVSTGFVEHFMNSPSDSMVVRRFPPLIASDWNEMFGSDRID